MMSWHGNTFPITGSVWVESASHMWIPHPMNHNWICQWWILPHEVPVMQHFYVFFPFFLSLSKLLNKESIHCWFEMTWHSCNVTVMGFSLLFSKHTMWCILHCIILSLKSFLTCSSAKYCSSLGENHQMYFEIWFTIILVAWSNSLTHCTTIVFQVKEVMKFHFSFKFNQLESMGESWLVVYHCIAILIVLGRDAILLAFIFIV